MGGTMKKSKIILPVIFIILTGLCLAQDEYVVVGGTQSYTHGSYDFLIYKLDTTGAKQWRKNFGGTKYDFGYAVLQTTDGGYVVAGDSESYIHGTLDRDFLIYKLDVTGNKLWRKNYGGTDSEVCYAIHQTSDGGIVLAGFTFSYSHGSGDSDFLIYKLDGSGNKLWRKNLGGTGGEWAHSIRQTGDGGYVVAGYTQSYTNGGYDFLIYKLDAAGAKVWRRNLGGADDDEAWSIRQTADGGYVVAGETDSYTHDADDTDFLVYKLDGAGNKQWRKNLGGTEEDVACAIRQTHDGGYVVAGYTRSYTHGSGDRDFLIYKLDATGAKLWRKNLGGTKEDVAYDIEPTDDGGYVVAGYTRTYTHGSDDFLIYKLDAAGAKQWRKNFGGLGTEYAYGVQVTSEPDFDVRGVWAIEVTWAGFDPLLRTITFTGTKSSGTFIMASASRTYSGSYSVQGKTVTFLHPVTSVRWCVHVGEFNLTTHMAGTMDDLDWYGTWRAWR